MWPVGPMKPSRLVTSPACESRRSGDEETSPKGALLSGAAGGGQRRDPRHGLTRHASEDQSTRCRVTNQPACGSEVTDLGYTVCQGGPRVARTRAARRRDDGCHRRPSSRHGVPKQRSAPNRRVRVTALCPSNAIRPVGFGRRPGAVAGACTHDEIATTAWWWRILGPCWGPERQTPQSTVSSRGARRRCRYVVSQYGAARVLNEGYQDCGSEDRGITGTSELVERSWPRLPMSRTASDPAEGARRVHLGCDEKVTAATAMAEPSPAGLAGAAGPANAFPGLGLLPGGGGGIAARSATRRPTYPMA